MASETIANGLLGANDRQVSDPVVATVAGLAASSHMIDPALIDAAARGWSANTQRAFLSDLALWGTWCRQNRVEAAEAGPEVVASWVRALAGIERGRAASLKARAGDDCPLPCSRRDGLSDGRPR